MAKTPDKELYLCMIGGRTCGKTTSQVAELGNSAILQMRALLPASGLILFISQELKRITKNKEMALACKQLLPPRVQASLSLLIKDRERMIANGKSRSVNLLPNGWAVVSSVKSPQLSYSIGPPALSCRCKEPTITTFPCLHELEKQIEKGAPVCSLVASKDTSKTWKSQYAELEVTPFFMNSVYKCNLGVHVVSVALRNPRGRPKKHKRIKGKLEKAMNSEKSKKHKQR